METPVMKLTRQTGSQESLQHAVLVDDRPPRRRRNVRSLHLWRWGDWHQVLEVLLSEFRHRSSIGGDRFPRRQVSLDVFVPLQPGFTLILRRPVSGVIALLFPHPPPPPTHQLIAASP
jgi:hypothetical protein